MRQGTRFGKLVIVAEVEKHMYPSGRTRRKFLCECDCGCRVAVIVNNLKTGNTTSCGCIQRKTAADNGRKAAKHSMARTRTYQCWDRMIQRCTNESRESYARYGGRGVSVCEKWRRSFIAFLDDMGERPSSRHSIDRIDNDGDYTPDNCRCATVTEQARNKSNNVLISHNGATRCVSEWAAIVGIGCHVLYGRLRRGWSATDALTTPVNGRRR